MDKVTANPAALHYQQVYVSDIMSLKYFFNELNGLPKAAPVSEAFGIPFLQATSGKDIVAFASFTGTADGSKGFTIHKTPLFHPAKEKEWENFVAEAFFRHTLQETVSHEQLRNNILRLTEWLNNGTA